MEFLVNTDDVLEIYDIELSDLLIQVFVQDGFSDEGTAKSLFDPASVRKRGKIIAAHDVGNSMLAGIVIVVPPDSPARRFANVNETEMQLLGVRSEYRRFGLGSALVKAAIDDAAKCGYSKMLLWTQTSMSAAHCLYEKHGFVRTPERDFCHNCRDFWFYEKVL